MLEYFVISIIVGVVGIVFTEVLMSAGMMFNSYAKWLDKLPDWLAYPLGTCIFCFTGQIAFWTYIVHWWNDYSILLHIGFVSLAIFYTLIYKQRYGG